MKKLLLIICISLVLVCALFLFGCSDGYPSYPPYALTEFKKIDPVGQVPEEFKSIIENNLFEYSNLYNVNIPAEVKGIRITKQGDAYFSDAFYQIDENTYTQHGEMIADTNPEDKTRDTNAFAEGYISITPMTKERTDLVAFDKLKKINL